MIEDLFPKTVGNILDYDAIKLAAKQYVEDVFVNIVQEFADNMTLYTMDSAHLADVAGHVAGDSSLSLEQLLDYINSENIYHECDFVSELLSAFPEGVEYKEFDVTGWGFPDSDFFPFNNENRSFFHDGTPYEAPDTLWRQNALGDLHERNLLMSRYKGQFDENDEPKWHRKEGRRSSWGNSATWMTTGGFGKPATIYINVDEERSVIEGNGLTAVENWLGTVSNKLPINLYIEIESHFVTNAEPASSSLEGYYMSFPYEEEEGFCTNDPAFSVEPIILPPEDRFSLIVVDSGTGELINFVIDENLGIGGTIRTLLETSDLETASTDVALMPEPELIIPDSPPSFTELTLYMESGRKYFQPSVKNTSSPSSASYKNQLYIDQECTTPFTLESGVTYEIGAYEGDVWIPDLVQKVTDMPAETTAVKEDATNGYILLITGELWFASSYRGTGTDRFSTLAAIVTFRAYNAS